MRNVAAVLPLLLKIARAELTSAQKSSDDYGSASRPAQSSIRRRHATFEDYSRSRPFFFETDTRMLKEGDRAPAFTAATDSGTAVSLGSLRGRRVILYFYPKDETSG